MTPLPHPKALEASESLFVGKDSPGVVFGAASAKLAWTFGGPVDAL
jgi:hypothetical protein